jgi:hypothetical protein
VICGIYLESFNEGCTFQGKSIKRELNKVKEGHINEVEIPWRLLSQSRINSLT